MRSAHDAMMLPTTPLLLVTPLIAGVYARVDTLMVLLRYDIARDDRLLRCQHVCR